MPVSITILLLTVIMTSAVIHEILIVQIFVIAALLLYVVAIIIQKYLLPDDLNQDSTKGNQPIVPNNLIEICKWCEAEPCKCKAGSV